MTANLTIPYGQGSLTLEVDPQRAVTVLAPDHAEDSGAVDELGVIQKALDEPLGTAPLKDLAKGRKNVVILTSDHTRPLPSHLTLPLLLAEIRKGSPKAQITVIVGVGCHRAMTEEEMIQRFGAAVVKKENIINHDPHDDNNLVSLGRLPSGGEFRLNKTAVEADLLVAEGFIEPHQFAGFSGGPKSVLPGVAAFGTVLASHNAEFTVHPKARPGSVAGNPIHADMLFAARKAGLAFILNVTLTPRKKVDQAFAGDVEMAHQKGRERVLAKSAVKAALAPIVITSNGGYPLDQNIYQSTKSIMQADLTCQDNGVIIAVNECRDGHGSQAFLDSFQKAASLDSLLTEIESRGRDSAIPDQWVTQLTASILRRRRVIMVTKAEAQDVLTLGMRKAASLSEALTLADELVGDPQAPITVLPNAVAVVIR
ncbi:MAG: nickel-dependent lactate racemase [Deltaproteobacteria bacterium]|jgi:nickel-dependent lactate racemase|nr:nickel-dependent lactate racemase [Deltaproteobacteria bacterium]